MRPLVVLSLVLWTGYAQAQPLNPVCLLGGQMDEVRANGPKLARLLLEKNFAAVEEDIDGRLRAVDLGSHSDLAAYLVINGTAPSNPALEPVLQQWVAQSPDSFVARLLKAVYHVHMGYTKRGSAFSSGTSDAQIDAMNAEFDKAMPELQAATLLRPKSAQPMAFAVRLAMGRGYGPGSVQRLVGEASALEPHGVATRYAAVTALAPKWGGSFEAMDAIVEAASSGRVGPSGVTRLRYAVELGKADHYSTVLKQEKLAIEHLRKATTLCPGPEPWRLIARVANSTEDWRTLSEAAGHLIRAEPVSAIAYRQRGYAREMLSEFGDAMNDYQSAADFGDAWAQNRLGFYLMIGRYASQDLAKARKLLEASAAQGNVNAKANLDLMNKQVPR